MFAITTGMRNRTSIYRTEMYKSTRQSLARPREAQRRRVNSRIYHLHPLLTLDSPSLTHASPPGSPSSDEPLRVRRACAPAHLKSAPGDRSTSADVQPWPEPLLHIDCPPSARLASKCTSLSLLAPSHCEIFSRSIPQLAAGS
jgi:hypothetical protein